MSEKTLAVLEKLVDEARALQGAGRWADAEEPLKKVVNLRKLVLGPKHIDTLRAEMNLAVSFRRRGDASLAVPILERVGVDLHPRLGELDAAYLYRMVLNNTGAAYLDTGQVDKAVAVFRLCLSLIEVVLPYDNDTAPEEYARVNDNLAGALIQIGDLAAAEEHAERALDRWKTLRPERDVDVLISMSHLGSLRVRRGDLAGARDFLVRVLEGMRAEAGDSHPMVGGAHNLLGTLEVLSGNLDDATKHFEASIAIGALHLSSTHPQVVEARSGLETIASMQSGPLH